MRHQVLRSVVLASTALLLAGTLGGCADDPAGDSSSSPATPSPAADPIGETLDAAALDGRSYASTSVEGRELAAGSAVDITFEGGRMSVRAGCNTLFGPFEVDGSTLAWTSAPAATMVMCEPDLAEQEQWLTEALTAGVRATVEGKTLTLQTDEVTIELAREAPDDLSALLGRTWTVIGTVADGAVSRLPVGARRPRLDVGADGLSRLFTGCRSGRVNVRVEGTSLVFSHAKVQRGRCTGPARRTEQAVLALLDGPSDNATLHDHLVVVTRGGEGLLFEIR